jgi:hypothetical protein
MLSRRETGLVVIGSEMVMRFRMSLLALASGVILLTARRALAGQFAS